MTRQIEPTKSYESFQAIIKFLQTKMHEKETDIADAEIAQRLKIPITAYYEYLEKDIAPEEIFEILRQEFKDVLHDIRIKRASVTFEVDLPDPDDADSEKAP
jgi:hypothetical protein